MMTWRGTSLGLMLSLVALSAQAADTITVNPSVAYQTFTDWEATEQAGNTGPNSSPYFGQYSNKLFDDAIHDLGITRLRVQIGNRTLGGDFELPGFDEEMREVAVPMRNKALAVGKPFRIYVCVVGNGLATNPTKYGQQVVKLYQHMQSQYGFLPDGWEIALEPNTFGWGGPNNVKNALVAAANQLIAAGYTPKFVAPSNSDVAGAITYFDLMISDSTVRQYLKEYSFHTYGGGTDANLQAVASRGQQYGMNTSMLEHIASDFYELHRLLKLANISAYQQYALAFPALSDDGAQYYFVSSTGAVTLANRTKFLRQYMKYIRPGAKRIQANTSNANFDPVAFINADGKYVVVVKADPNGGAFSVGSLPAGTYGLKYTTFGVYNVDHPDVTISSGQSISTSIPTKGVLTIYQKTSATMLLGDLDSDGDVDLDDLRRMIYMLVGTVTPDLSKADLDGDGALRLADLQALVKILVGIP